MVQLIAPEEPSGMPMVMVLRTMFNILMMNLINSIIQLFSVPLTMNGLRTILLICTILITETCQAMLERKNTKEDQTTSHHTSIHNSVMEFSELMLDLKHIMMEHVLMFSEQTNEQN